MSALSDYRIPKTPRQIAVTLHSGETLMGDIFLQQVGRFGSAEEPLDILNAPEAFFPLRTQDGDTVLVARDQVISVHCDRGDDEDSIGLTPRITVDVRLIHGQTFRGSVLLDMPAQNSRLLDFLNRSRQRFVAMNTDEGRLLVNRSMIESVRSLD
jgi:hypothetical protein